MISGLNPIFVIHQVLILDGFAIPANLPTNIVRNTDRARELYPSASYKMWSGNEIRAFIDTNFSSEVLTAFDTLRPYSYKCDLARFCLLYVYGGLYLDLAVKLTNAWAIPRFCEIAAFTEMYPGMESWTATQTSLLWSQPRRPEWKLAIDWIVENCRTRYYGPHDHYPTAGALLGRAFAAVMASRSQTNAADDQWMGECRYVTPESAMQNLCYVAPDRLLVGLRTKLVSGDLTEMGLRGTNNYLKIWKARQAYGEVDHVWRFDDSLIRVEKRAVKTPTGVAVVAGTVGRVTYGPFVDLEAGTYRLRLDFSPETRFSRLLVNVSARYGALTLYELRIDRPDRAVQAVVEVEFTLEGPQTEVEFRPSVFGDFVGELRGFRLQRTQIRTWAFDNTQIALRGVKRTATGIAIGAGTRGQVLYGPYTKLGTGDYVLKATFGPKTRFGRLIADVCAGDGSEIIAVRDHRQAVAEHEAVELRFSLDRPRSNVEFRLEVFGDFEGEFQRFTLASA